MSVAVETGATVSFDRFWSWLKRHPNCIVRVGGPDTFLHDQEPFHWHLEEDAERNPVVQLVWGKLLVAEMILDVRDVIYVEATPEQGGDPGQFVFELVGGTKDEAYPLYHFVMAHGLEDEGEHSRTLKH